MVYLTRAANMKSCLLRLKGTTILSIFANATLLNYELRFWNGSRI